MVFAMNRLMMNNPVNRISEKKITLEYVKAMLVFSAKFSSFRITS